MKDTITPEVLNKKMKEKQTKALDGSDAPTCSPYSDTPETDAKREAMDYIRLDGYYRVDAFAEFARKLERERNALREQMSNNPWCAACKETDCCVSGDGTCSMIRKYLSQENACLSHGDESAR